MLAGFEFSAIYCSLEVNLVSEWPLLVFLFQQTLRMVRPASKALVTGKMSPPELTAHQDKTCA